MLFISAQNVQTNMQKCKRWELETKPALMQNACPVCVQVSPGFTTRWCLCWIVPRDCHVTSAVNEGQVRKIQSNVYWTTWKPFQPVSPVTTAIEHEYIPFIYSVLAPGITSAYTWHICQVARVTLLFLLSRSVGASARICTDLHGRVNNSCFFNLKKEINSVILHLHRL